MARENYHHGNLRQELLDLAIVELEKEGLANLSLRKLSAQIGVARSAPYRHFASRDELLYAIVQTLSIEMRRVFFESLNSPEPAQDRLRSAFKSSIALALSRPEFYRLAFSDQPNWRLHFEQEKGAAKTFGIFKALIASASENKSQEALHNRAIAVWSLVHGFSMLRLNGGINGDGFVDVAEETVLDLAVKIASGAE